MKPSQLNPTTSRKKTGENNLQMWQVGFDGKQSYWIFPDFSFMVICTVYVKKLKI